MPNSIQIYSSSVISVAFILFLFRSPIILLNYNFIKKCSQKIEVHRYFAVYFHKDQRDECGIFKGILSPVLLSVR